MAIAADAASLLRARLTVGKAIDDSAELSFLESAHFRLELFGIVSDLDKHVLTEAEAEAALTALGHRVSAVIATGSLRP
jgi:hypothetical protein